MPGMIASVGHDVFVGTWEACDAHANEFDHAIHVYHPACSPTKCCKAWSETFSDHPPEIPSGLYLKLAEGAALKTCPTPIEEIAEFCRQPGRLLIHCTYGQQRSSMLAILAKAVRGANVFKVAMGEVAEGLWNDRRIAPFWCALPLADIFMWQQLRETPKK